MFVSWQGKTVKKSFGKVSSTAPITSLKDPIIADARRRLAAAPADSGACFLADGAKMVRQAIQAGADIQTLFFLDPIEQDEDRQALDLARQANLPCHLLKPGIFFKVLDLGYRTSVGCLAVVARPPSAPLDDLPPDACLLAGQSIQDPRNVGVLIRTADAWAARTLFSADSADPWSRPAVRSTTGSIFRAPVTLSADLGGELRRLRDRGVAIIGSSARSRRAVWELDLRGPVVLLVGNETAGLPADLLDLCDQAARIPMTGSAHSFNVTVAAGILLYECQRQRSSSGTCRPAGRFLPETHLPQAGSGPMAEKRLRSESQTGMSALQAVFAATIQADKPALHYGSESQTRMSAVPAAP